MVELDNICKYLSISDCISLSETCKHIHSMTSKLSLFKSINDLKTQKHKLRLPENIFGNGILLMIIMYYVAFALYIYNFTYNFLIICGITLILSLFNIKTSKFIWFIIFWLNMQKNSNIIIGLFSVSVHYFLYIRTKRYKTPLWEKMLYNGIQIKDKHIYDILDLLFE